VGALCQLEVRDTAAMFANRGEKQAANEAFHTKLSFLPGLLFYIAA
jgi:hypothetical protein